jgi:integrase/recombinase XerD
MVAQTREEAKHTAAQMPAAERIHVDGFAQWMRDAGYTANSIRTSARLATHLASWCARSHIALSDLNEQKLLHFDAHLQNCSCPRRAPQACGGRKVGLAARFLQYLRLQGTARAAEPARRPPLQEEFERWMREHRGASPRTLHIYGRVVTALVSAMGVNPGGYTVLGIRAFVLQQSKKFGRSQTKLVMTATRAFMRYLISVGAVRAGLDAAVPTIAGWRMASLPRGLSSFEITRVIETCDRRSPSGLRNRAMLLLMARLGLRAGDIAALRVEDIDWRGASITVAGKSRRRMKLPLSQEVGDAILAYVPHRVSNTASGKLFVRLKPPYGPITSSVAGSVSRTAIQAAGVQSPVRGSHVLRHSAASDLLRQGATLDHIQAVLRHRDPETTLIYAKVDFASLRALALPWPEVSPC